MKKTSEKLSNLHKEKLGLDIPIDFFSKSKTEILKAVPKDKTKPIFKLNPLIAYPAAASIIFLIGITFFWLQDNSREINPTISNIETISYLNAESDNFLISSLLIDDKNMSKFLDDYILKEIIVEAEVNEQALENMFINSMFIEDSLINTYLEETLIENLVL